MIHVGRYTAALLLIVTGVALVLDQTSGTQYLRTMSSWWPVILIILGVEVILLSLIFRERGARLQFSFGSVFGAVIIVFVVMQITGFGEGQFDVKRLRFWEFAWKEVERPVERISIDDSTETIRILSRNSKVVVQSGESDEIEIQSVLKYLNILGEKQAREVEEQSKIHITEGKTLLIEPKGKRYRNLFWQNEARIDLVITVPSQMVFAYDLQLTNGDVTISNLDTDDRIRIRTTNGDITVDTVSGELDISTRNGDIRLRNADSSVQIKTSNGDINISNVSSSVQAVTSNGDIGVVNVYSGLDIRTSNGDVVIRSPEVRGDWQIETRNGDVSLYVPETGDYRLQGTGPTGRVTLPWLKVKSRSVEGQTGDGTYLVELKTNNGDLDIQSYETP